VRGKCTRHGGYPLCSEEACHFCDPPVTYRDGGVRGKCSKHGGMPKCIVCVLFGVKQKGLRCAYCRPASAIAKRAKREEEAVASFLSDSGIPFQRETTIDYRCIDSDSKRRAYLDFVMEMSTKRVILEIDERQHSDVTYEIQCDLARMMFVMSAIHCDQNERPTLWIRFNPNAFAVDGRKVTVSKKKKYERLLAILTEDAVPNGTEILYMYYDTCGDLPVICQDVTYHESVQKLLRKPIIQ
jgi:hypothetical protein